MFILLYKFYWILETFKEENNLFHEYLIANFTELQQ